MRDPPFFVKSFCHTVGRALIEYSNQRKGELPLQSDKTCLRYQEAAAILPARLRALALTLPESQQMTAEEFRLRAGQPFSVLLPEGERMFSAVVEPTELETLCNLATEYSRYAAAETLREGYLSVRGGFRVGLCGTAVMKDGTNTNLKDLSSA